MNAGDHYGVWLSFCTILRREITRFCRIWVQTLIPPVISMSLYFIVFGALIGRRIGQLDGYSYIEYITPGIILISVINSAYANVSSSFFSAKFQKFIEEMLIAPIPGYVILLGYVCGGVARSLIVAVLVTLVAMQFTEIQLHNPWVAAAVVLLTAMLFSLGGLINGIFADKFDDISIVPTFVLAPLTYLGGVFYTINLLPEPWRIVSLFNPILYMVNAFRYGLLGVTDVDPAFACGFIVAAVAILFFVALALVERGVGLKT